jgi:hypothetical protein
MSAASAVWSARRLAFAAVAALAWFALVVQVLLSLTNPANYPGTLEVRLNNLFSYFTILSNLVVAVTLTTLVLSADSTLARRFARPRFFTGVAVAIVLVCLGYELLLRGIWKLEGWALVADTLFHDVVPIGFVLLWAAFVPKGQLGPRDLPSWLIYPGVYLGYVLVRGALIQRYPYPFLDVTALGYGRVLFNAAGLAVVIVALGGLFIAADRFIAGRRGVGACPTGG